VRHNVVEKSPLRAASSSQAPTGESSERPATSAANDTAAKAAADRSSAHPPSSQAEAPAHADASDGAVHESPRNDIVEPEQDVVEPVKVFLKFGMSTRRLCVPALPRARAELVDLFTRTFPGFDSVAVGPNDVCIPVVHCCMPTTHIMSAHTQIYVRDRDAAVFYELDSFSDLSSGVVFWIRNVAPSGPALAENHVRRESVHVPVAEAAAGAVDIPEVILEDDEEDDDGRVGSAQLPSDVAMSLQVGMHAPRCCALSARTGKLYHSHRHADTQTHRYTDTQTQIHRHADTQAHAYMHGFQGESLIDSCQTELAKIQQQLRRLSLHSHRLPGWAALESASQAGQLGGPHPTSSSTASSSRRTSVSVNATPNRVPAQGLHRISEAVRTLASAIASIRSHFVSEMQVNQRLVHSC
jgi:hypothetical protein